MHAAMARRQAKRTRKRAKASIGVIAALGMLVLAAVIVPLALRSSPPTAPPAPLALAQWAAGGPVSPGGVVNRPLVTVSFRAGAGTSAAVPVVEVAALHQTFHDAITVRGDSIAAGTQPTAMQVRVPHLRDGMAYRWRVRLDGRDGRVSPWVAFSGSAASFRVDLTPPAAPVLSSPTDPDPSAWYNTSLAALDWPAPADASGIAGYAYSLDHNPRGVPAARLMVGHAGIDVVIPDGGHWYVHVRAADRAGNWGPSATYPVQVDLHPAAFANVVFAQTSFDPDVEHERVAMTLTAPAHLQARILDQYTGALVRGIDMGRAGTRATLIWDGRDDAGRAAPAGAYRFLITATDRFGQQAVADYSDISLVRRRVVISLSQQRMVVYDGSRVMLTTLVTTGNKALPTPLGVYHIIEKRHPFTFISPWPQGSPYYYAPSPVQYALLFDWRGLYIHDAPWRSVFGPGSNAHTGTPGQNYTGSHGCVNVPPNVAAWLYNWAPIGATVQVVP